VSTKPTKTTATLIRKLPLTESSLILHWCSDDYGLVKSVAKGARRPKSPFAGKLDLFYRCEVEIVPARQGDLHILKDVCVRDSRLGIRGTYPQTLAASYFVKLIEMVTEPETPVPDLADLLERGLNYLNTNPPTRRAMRHFEKQLAECLGVAEEGRESVRCIGDTFGALPKQREELLRCLGEPGSNGP
jgi:DNA repair protein RecO (recombination protein O)